MTHKPAYTHEDVFGDLNRSNLSAQEALDYLDIDLAELKTALFSGALLPAGGEIDALQFSADSLRRYKQSLLSDGVRRAEHRDVSEQGDRSSVPYGSTSRRLDPALSRGKPISRETMEAYGERRAERLMKMFGNQE